MFKTTPLSAGFFLFGLLGAIIFGVRTYSGTIDPTWGFLMTFFSIILFISAVVSITPEIPTDYGIQKEIRGIKKEYKVDNVPKKKITTKKKTVKRKTTKKKNAKNINTKKKKSSKKKK